MLLHSINSVFLQTILVNYILENGSCPFGIKQIVFNRWVHGWLWRENVHATRSKGNEKTKWDIQQA